MKKMNHSWITGIALGAMAVCVAFVAAHPGKVQATTHAPQVLVIQGTQNFDRNGSGYAYPDIMVHCASASDPAIKPVLPRFGADGYPDQYVPLAIALASAKSAGYRITWHDNLTFVLERD